MAEQLELVGAALLAVFTEEERARTPEFEHDLRDFFGRINADTAKIVELESSPIDADQFMVVLLRGRIDVLWRELFAAIEDRGSFADRKFLSFMALLFPIFNIIDFPYRPGSDAKMLMELMIYSSTVH